MGSKKPNAKHILLTGLPGVGKTTLIRKIYDVFKEKNIPVIGFYTEELRNDTNSRIGFDVVTLDGKRGRLARTFDMLAPHEHSKFKVGNYHVFLNEFESLVLPLLNKPVQNEVIVIDEIGKMEMFSQPFVKKISDLFNKPNLKIIATIPVQRGKPLPVVEQLRNDPTNYLITVDRGNRNNLLPEIIKIMDGNYN